MTKAARSYPPPISIRLSADERISLEKAAQSMTLSAYIRLRLFGESGVPRRTSGKLQIKDHKALAEVLAKLGASRLASNLNQLAKGVNMGSLPVTPETEHDLRAACRDIRAIKRLLMTALGIQER